MGQPNVLDGLDVKTSPSCGQALTEVFKVQSQTLLPCFKWGQGMDFGMGVEAL
jgi:hypothetical protein